MNSKLRSSLPTLQTAYNATISKMNLLGACVFPEKLSNPKLIDYAKILSHDLENNKTTNIILSKKIKELQEPFKTAFEDFEKNRKQN